VLATVARRIQTCLRHNDMAARLGGDEVRGPCSAMCPTWRPRMPRHSASPTRSVGPAKRGWHHPSTARPASVSPSPVRRTSSTPCYAGADTALYTAKADGKGQWRSYHDAHDQPGPPAEPTCATKLEAAIKDDKLTLHYQPIVDMTTGRARGFEALIRFDRVSPSTHGA